VGALLFALHPVQTEAVTYVSGRSSSLAASLALASILVWMRGVDEGRPALAGLASPALMLASMGVKETAVALPAALVLLRAVDVRDRFSWRQALRATAPHWLVLAAVGVVFLASPTYGRMVEASRSLRPPGENLLVHASALAWLAGQVVRPDRLNADPDPATVTAVPGGPAAALVGLAAVAGLLLVRRRPSLAFGVLWFLLWLAPAGWAVPRREPASDRQLYLALAGPAWLAGRWLSPWAMAGGARRLAVAALVVALGAATAWRNRVYADPVVFWEDVVAKSPGHARAYNNLGHSLAGACRLAEAEAALSRAIELDPGYVRAGVNLRLLREGAALGPGEPPCPRPGGPPAVP
jgi:MYXO-CTERM domain-containing protein